MLVTHTRTPLMCLLSGAFVLSAAMLPAHAEDAGRATGKSFVETFDRLDTKRWYISDGWSNGDHQNCTWSAKQVSVEGGRLKLGFAKQDYKQRHYVCAEVQTKERFGYGAFEVRMKALSGSGLNSGFFSFIGPVDKQPHDEIDFEVLGKDPSKVQINQYVNGKSVGSAKLAPVAGGADQDFHDYAFVWQKDRIAWYVDGKLVDEATDPAKLPSHASKIFVSVWGTDTLTSWMGAFADPGRPIAAEVKRVAYTAPGDACQFPESIVCKLKQGTQ
ncbi:MULTISPECIES: glycoside hydrolase family 16 protein [unclassified Mesorhizobium]|uniref:endo-1,3-1,4-beta-glycanase ExoK n=1 Tax=unclassified Mesorhizobium TaxID=325217 RepID=UPI00095C3E7B|nr:MULTISPECIES: glycoside hydrolase family 16 protein [unclassified Mesorhizobium]OJX70766.1 MAG: 1,3-1,4-beta-glycanase [Mesorhizobium sp. 65-26]